MYGRRMNYDPENDRKDNYNGSKQESFSNILMVIIGVIVAGAFILANI